MKENVAPSSSSTSDDTTSTALEPLKGSPKKSLIPLPTTSTNKSLVSRAGSTRDRKPLNPLNLSTKMMLGRQSSASSSPPAKKSGIKKLEVATPSSPVAKVAPTCASTPISTSSSVLKERLHKSNKLVDKEVQTDHPDLELITGDEPPTTYWKQLAETRREALEEALQENEKLHERVKELEKDNEEMEEMVAHAKNLASIIASITDDSGIGTDESNAADQSVSDDHQRQQSDSEEEDEDDD